MALPNRDTLRHIPKKRSGFFDQDMRQRHRIGRRKPVARRQRIRLLAVIPTPSSKLEALRMLGTVPQNREGGIFVFWFSANIRRVERHTGLARVNIEIQN